MKEVKIPCAVYSASLLKENKIFVCGGEDLKLYKYNYETGEEIGEGLQGQKITLNKIALVGSSSTSSTSLFTESFKGHFGPVHCVRFSPDGELYASGSEDGTLRLWQTEVNILTNSV